MKRTCLAALLVAVAGGAEAGCPGDMVAVTKKGHFAAPTVRAYRELVRLQTRRELGALRDRVDAGRLARLPAGREACIHDSSPLSYRTLITMPGLPEPHWVHLNALDW